jgi:spore germination protein
METEIYVVQPDDTLKGIANKFGIPMAEILSLNSMSPFQPLVVGQAILIPHVRKAIQSLAYFHLDDLENLERTLVEIAPFISLGGVFQFPITTGGAIPIVSETNVSRIVGLLKSHGILPLMVITNLTPAKFDPDLARAVIGDDVIKARLIRNFIVLLEHFGFSGINIDFENVYPEDRGFFTNFIRDLKLAFEPNGYLVTLAVPPKNSDEPESPGKGAYDYQALGQWADFVFIMTYDWGVIGGPPMAVSPINEVQKVLSYAVTKIPPDKILQGIPLYGYNWQLPYGPESLTTVVNLVNVIDLARRYHAVIQYDPVAQSPNFGYTDEKGQEHIVWFEDARSVKVKYKMSRSFNLGGVGFWSSKNYPFGFPQNWRIFAEMFLPIHWIK